MHNDVVLHANTGEIDKLRYLVKGLTKNVRVKSCSSELGRLEQGIKDVKGTYFISLIAKTHQKLK